MAAPPSEASSFSGALPPLESVSSLGAEVDAVAAAMRSAVGNSRSLEGLDKRLVRMPDGSMQRDPDLAIPITPLEVLETVVENLEQKDEGLLQQVKRLKDADAYRQAVLTSEQWTLDPPQSLENWAEVLAAEGVDADAAASLSRLASRDPLGHAEASRLIARLTKGSNPWVKGPSQWLQLAVREAEEYLEDWRRFESSWVDWSRPRSNAQRASWASSSWSASSSSSSSSGAPRVMTAPGGTAWQPWGGWAEPLEEETDEGQS